MIEPVSKDNLAEVLPLIHNYQAFYHTANISDAKNAAFFAQFGETNPAGCQFIYREEQTLDPQQDINATDQPKQVVGFATVYFSFASTIAAKIAVLNDLYTLPAYRGRGIGRQLITHCREYAIQQGAKRLQWITAPDNKAAQKLYNSLDTQQSTWHLYTY